MGKELLGQWQLVALGTVMRHQKPTCEALFQRMIAIAGGRLRNLAVIG